MMLARLHVRLACCAILVGPALGALAARQTAVPLPATVQATGVNASVRLVLPKIVVAGERATLAVLGADGALVPGAEVELPGGQLVRTDSSGRATFIASGAGETFSARLTWADVRGEAVLAPAVSHNSAEAFADAKITGSPRAIALGEPFELIGSNFHGDVAQEHVVLGNQPALLLAASPVSLIAMAGPRTPLGETQLSVFIGQRGIPPRPVTLVSLAISAQSTALTFGARGSLYVWIYGTEKPLIVEVHGLTPDVLNLAGGGVRRLLTSGGPANTARFIVNGAGAGDYVVGASLLPERLGAPDAMAAHRELLDAWTLADIKWQKRLHPLLKALENAGADPGGDLAGKVADVRKRIAREMQERPPQRIAESLRVAAELLDAD